MYYDGALRYSSRIYFSEDATAEQRDKISEEYGGDRSATVGVQIEDKTVSLDIYGLKNNTVRFPSDKGGYTELKDNGAYICERLAEEFELDTGDTFVLSPYGTDKKYTLKLNGIIRSTSECVVITEEYADTLNIDYTPDSVYTKTVKKDIKPTRQLKPCSQSRLLWIHLIRFLK